LRRPLPGVATGAPKQSVTIGRPTAGRISGGTGVRECLLRAGGEGPGLSYAPWGDLGRSGQAVRNPRAEYNGAVAISLARSGAYRPRIRQ